MRAGLFQEQRLHLSLTKELAQAIELLQYSTLELRSFLHEQSLENPFLEIKDHKFVRTPKQSRNGETRNWIENIGKSSETLASYLKAQLHAFPLSAKRRQILHYLIASLDEDGYLRMEMKETAALLSLSEEELEDAIQFLQSLEPAGVGARSLQECLLIQLQRLPVRHELAERVIADYFTMFVEKTWKALAKQLKISISNLQEIWDLIRTLEPRPGSHYAAADPHFIVPDLIVTKRDGEICVWLNDEFLPEVIWNHAYEKKVADQQDEQIEWFVREKYRQFMWLTKSLEQRKQTLVLVVKEIMERQKQCLEEGLAALRPLTMRDIADALNIHESTVSRVIRNKYVQTPFGTVELRHFFTNSLSAENDNEEASAAKTKELIKKLIEAEDKHAPLSDQKIADLLNEEHQIAISRRTVAKYREQLHIPSSAKRKRY
ncbi:RNA polymerase sigma-54 factor [Anoxybacillus sp. B7M1]|jgi:RNA polymerase sigma-54 factor|uniref:RNA polymerase factor sigma-54 n=1 Tax=unclassified Anoxybacillus TaxID=2639704 RepID=UPI0005CD8C04|nr:MULTISPECIES: RNA polymerase factor sigma-54 [unclassified Anoxybacillus]ANB55669.1 RNA polymerase sigma-54 factor [Anoxybacillus sp. B2M1]ANB63997.1 RNA polymerase sigma-54 factor [Anoxybacillus sp. B7M1]